LERPNLCDTYTWVVFELRLKVILGSSLSDPYSHLTEYAGCGSNENLSCPIKRQIWAEAKAFDLGDDTALINTCCLFSVP
jgi:hypothetical protein